MNEIKLIPGVVLVFICMVFSGIPAFSNDNEPTFVFEEDFEDGFPPEGWILDSTDLLNTWNAFSTASNGLIGPKHGDKFLYIDGDGEMESDEYLVTKKIDITNLSDFELNGYMIWESPFSNESLDFDLEISFCQDFDNMEDPVWTKIFSWRDEMLPEEDQLKWTIFRIYFDKKEKENLWLSFHYYGSYGSGIGLDWLCLYAWGGDPQDDDIDDDQDDEDDSTDDDAVAIDHKHEDDDNADDDSDENVSEDDDDNDDGQCSGCASSGNRLSFPLTLCMFLIGLGAWIFSRKKG